MVCEAKILSVVSLAVVSWSPSVAKRSNSAVTRLRLSSSDGGPLEMTPNAGGDKGFQLRCKGQVVLETEGYTAKADKFTFVSGKNLLIFESLKADAQLTSHRDKPGQNSSYTARRICLRLSTGQVEVHAREPPPARPDGRSQDEICPSYFVHLLFAVNQYNIGPPQDLARHWPLTDVDMADLISRGCNTILFPLHPSF